MDESITLDYYLVALKTPFMGSVLTYSSPTDRIFLPGQIVQCPLRTRTVMGVVIQKTTLSEIQEFEIREIQETTCPDLDLSTEELSFYQWASQYYHYPLGLLIFDSLPKIPKRTKELSWKIGEGFAFDYELNEDQIKVYDALKNHRNHFHKALLHGVTGSGKTSVYLKLMQDVLKQGRSVLFLLPEINLTPQFIDTMAKFTDVPVFAYHSGIKDHERYQLWLSVKKKSPVVIVGVRSSIFLPLTNLGLIIVDEEHDSSFKQDDRCPYHARDLAIMKAHRQKILIVLGSATPSFESYYQAVIGSSQEDCPLNTSYHVLSQRAGTGHFPKITLISSCEESPGKKRSEKPHWPLENEVITKIQEALNKNEQVLVFVNRLGFSNYLICRACGHEFYCPNCSTHLRYFKNRKELSCYICGHKDQEPEMCPQCSNIKLLPKGFGTEKVIDVLRPLFPERRLERLDRDEIKTLNQLEERLKAFHQGEIDILIGTQMLSKGHNFQKVNLVVILGIDSQLNYPDFRANEKVYQLVKQVSGRAGRYHHESEVLIQTYAPQNTIFKLVQSTKLQDFYEYEKPFREIADCPPFSKMAMLYLFASKQSAVVEFSIRLEKILQTILITPIYKDSVSILGPRAGLIEKKVNTFMWSFLIKSSRRDKLHRFISHLEYVLFEEISSHSSRISYKIDVDPQTLA